MVPLHADAIFTLAYCLVAALEIHCKGFRKCSFCWSVSFGSFVVQKGADTCLAAVFFLALFEMQLLI